MAFQILDGVIDASRSNQAPDGRLAANSRPAKGEECRGHGWILALRPAEEQAALDLEARDDLERDGQAAGAGQQAEELAPRLAEPPGAIEMHGQRAVAAPPDGRVGIDQSLNRALES